MSYLVQVMEVPLLSGDIIIAGTDGLFDNVFAEEVASLVSFARSRGDSPARVARALVDYTEVKSQDTTHLSPFAYAAQVRCVRECVSNGPTFKVIKKYWR